MIKKIINGLKDFFLCALQGHADMIDDFWDTPEEKRKRYEKRNRK